MRNLCSSDDRMVLLKDYITSSNLKGNFCVIGRYLSDGAQGVKTIRVDNSDSLKYCELMNVLRGCYEVSIMTDSSIVFKINM